MFAKYQFYPLLVMCLSYSSFSFQTHKWVNAESMLEKCFIGPLQRSNVVKKTKPSRTGTCHMSQLRVADFFEDTVWYSNMSRGKSMAISNSPSYYKHCKADIMENY